MQIVILCGGKATRLKSIIGETPKILAAINGLPFLDFLLNYLRKFNSVSEILFLTGIGSGKIKEFITQKSLNINIPMRINADRIPGQGTAQALLQSWEDQFLHEEFLLMFGDSLPEINLNKFIKFGRNSNSDIFFSYINKNLVTEDARITKNNDNIIYHEDISQNMIQNTDSFVDYGVYFIKKNQELKNILQKESDLKKVLEKFTNIINCQGLEIFKPFIEIGNPTSYASAKELLKKDFKNE